MVALYDRVVRVCKGVLTLRTPNPTWIPGQARDDVGGYRVTVGGHAVAGTVRQRHSGQTWYQESQRKRDSHRASWARYWAAVAATFLAVRWT